MTTILLVEDELNHRLLYQTELEDDGYRVVLASDGWGALQQVKEEHPDLVVLDLGMPGMDGIEALWRMVGLNAKLPVIIYSAYDNSQDNFMTWLADAYLVKSSNLDVLKGEIEQVLLETRKSFAATATHRTSSISPGWVTGTVAWTCRRNRSRFTSKRLGLTRTAEKNRETARPC